LADIELTFFPNPYSLPKIVFRPTELSLELYYILQLAPIVLGLVLIIAQLPREEVQIDVAFFFLFFFSLMILVAVVSLSIMEEFLKDDWLL
jgi:hypothetical protein